MASILLWWKDNHGVYNHLLWNTVDARFIYNKKVLLRDRKRRILSITCCAKGTEVVLCWSWLGYPFPSSSSGPGQEYPPAPSPRRDWGTLSPGTRDQGPVSSGPPPPPSCVRTNKVKTEPSLVLRKREVTNSSIHKSVFEVSYFTNERPGRFCQNWQIQISVLPLCVGGLFSIQEEYSDTSLSPLAFPIT